MVAGSVKDDASIPCHETTYGDCKEGESVCRGFFDSYKTTPLQVAERLNMIEYT
jgi:hypothetical protein